MKLLIKNIILCLFLFWNALSVNAQAGNSITSITSEIVTIEGINKLLPRSKVIPSGGAGDVDIDEQLYYQIRSENLANPAIPLPIGCFLYEINYIVKFGDNIYGPISIDSQSISQALSSSRYSTTPRQLLLPFKSQVLDKLNSRNITNLEIYIRGVWKSKANGIPITCANYNQIKSGESRTDNFTLKIKKFGLIALVDLAPLSASGAEVSLDVVSGLVKNLSKTSIDYVAVLNNNSFSNALVSVPILRHEGRSWVSKNFEIETVLSMNLTETQKPIGFGIGVGAFGAKDKTVKCGVFWQNGTPNYYLGLSVRGLANFLGAYK
jgi:hypothetical protein